MGFTGINFAKCRRKLISTFSQSLLHTLKQYNVTLIGGDTTKGNLSITITAQGFVEKQRNLSA